MDKLNKISNILKTLFLSIGYIILFSGLIMFCIVNKQVFFNSSAMTALFVIGLLIMPVLIVALKKIEDNKKVKIATILLLIVDFAFYIYIIIASQVTPKFQPMLLTSTSSMLLIVGATLILFGAVFSIISKKANLMIASTVMLLIVSLTGILWANTQDYKPFYNYKDEPVFLFKPNESGYFTFRIPSLYAVNKNTLNTIGIDAETDPIYAFTEGRINGSEDKGDIDIVYKYSTDNGETWSDVKTLLTFGNEVGKYGNPTVVLNKETGKLHMFYMKADAKTNYHYQSYHCELNFNEDLSLKVNEDSIKDISLKLDAGSESGGADGVRSDTLMVGPGKGAYIDSGKYKGRIVMPCSNDKHSFVVYSDDDGATWNNLNNTNEVKSAGLGNECEATFVGGKLVMVVRDNIGCVEHHPKQFIRLSVSSDGGATWEKKTVDTTLKTPICMSSVDNFNGNFVISYPDDYNTRANLSISMYKGNSFTTIPIYSGASGYSSIATTSDNDMFVIAEVGKLNYNESIVLVKVDMEKFNK